MSKMKKEDNIVIEPLVVGKAQIWIRGLSPFVCNAMSAKAKRSLILPPGRKMNATEKATNLKHDPIDEYRNSTYRRKGSGNTRILFPATGFKGAMCNAALDTPGVAKTQIGRLVWVLGDMVDMYGAPKLWMNVVRMADQARTPDVRTRAILPEWAACITIQFVTPILTDSDIAKLMGRAGLLSGVGDFRQGKGKGSYGQFEMCDKSAVEKIIKNGGRVQQDAALKDPEFYDVETEELFSWYNTERTKRGR